MKKNLFLLILLLSIPFSAFAWDNTDYAKYNFETFSKLPAVNQRIDFTKIDYKLLNAAIFYETNRQRALHNRRPFLHSALLEKAAQDHSMDMVKFNFFSHYSRVTGKRDLTDRIRLVNFKYRTIGENIATNFGIEYEGGRSVYSPVQNGGYFSYTYRGKPIENRTYLGLAQSFLKQWMNSPGHRANILNKNFTHLGAGTYYYQEKSFYNMAQFNATQNFGTPAE